MQETVIDNNWQQHKFDKIAFLIKDQFDPKKNHNPKICIELENIQSETGRLNGYFSTKNLSSTKIRFQPNDVLFGKLRPYLNKYIYANFSGVCSTEIWVLRANIQKCLPQYLFYIVQHSTFLKFANITAGTKMPRADWNVVKEIELKLPSILEQEKIAEILSSCDRAIELTEKLITSKRKLKRGLMQKLLTGKLRFPEFEGQKWKKCKLSDLFDQITRRNNSHCSLVVTISGAKGLIDQKEFFNRRVASENLDNYYLLKRGEFAYNRSSMRGYPFGAIKRLEKYPQAAVSTLYICFGLKEKLENSDFWKYYFESGKLNSQIYSIAHEGARSHGLLNLQVKRFFQLDIYVPSLQEQEKISSALNAIDTELQRLEHKLSNFKKIKKGLMQQLLTGKTRVSLNQ